MDKLEKRVLKRFNELISVLNFKNSELSDDMLNKIDLNIKLLSLYCELKSEPYSEVNAVGFSECETEAELFYDYEPLTLPEI